MKAKGRASVQFGRAGHGRWEAAGTAGRPWVPGGLRSPAESLSARNINAVKQIGVWTRDR